MKVYSEKWHRLWKSEAKEPSITYCGVNGQVVHTIIKNQGLLFGGKLLMGD